MPDFRSIDALRARLHQEFALAAPGREATPWGAPARMRHELRRIQQELGAVEDDRPAEDVLQSSLQSFADTGSGANFTQLKHVCYGICVPLKKQGWRIVERPLLLRRLLDAVRRRQNQSKQFRRCYQGLLSSYLSFDGRQIPSEGGVDPWADLREFLQWGLMPMDQAQAQRHSTPPTWLEALRAHTNLLSPDPCGRYAKEFASGHFEGFESLCASLGVSANSWLWDEALLGYTRHVCGYADTSFKGKLPALLAVINGDFRVPVSERLSIAACAAVVKRYSQCESRPEIAPLRDTCIRWIGNPWVMRTAWDAHVGHEPAREMIVHWLKERLIKDFFELLAQDGAADLNRLRYWLKWEPHISDMWFVLGADARRNPSQAFADLRKRMVGRERILYDPKETNNAFVMKIGPLLAIEFGVTGNACYLYPDPDARPDLDSATSFSRHELKRKSMGKPMSHVGNWEAKFDQEMERWLRPPRAGIAPTRDQPPRAAAPVHDASSRSTEVHPAGIATAPLPPAIEERAVGLCRLYGVKFEDRRAWGEGFWVFLRDPTKHLALDAFLKRSGFRHVPGKGYWYGEAKR